MSTTTLSSSFNSAIQNDKMSSNPIISTNNSNNTTTTTTTTTTISSASPSSSSSSSGIASGSTSVMNSPYINNNNSNNNSISNSNNNNNNNNNYNSNNNNDSINKSVNNNNNNNNNSNKQDNNTFTVKSIIFNDKKKNILTQKENGPCPLIAIVNVLSLRGEIEINDNTPITYDGLVERIGSHLFESIKNYENTEEQFDYEIKINDSINALPTMINGLNLDVRFTGIKDFDSSCDISIFKVLNIDLVHGWLVDPQDVELVSIVGDLTYNKLTEKICNSKLEEEFLNDTSALAVADLFNNFNIADEKSSINMAEPSGLSKKDSIAFKNNRIRNIMTDSVKYKNNPIKSSGEDLFSQFKIKQFLADTSSQLSYHGLYELHSNLNEGELVIFFRNNHFNTMLKRNQELYLLVTDEGYINEPIVWERLSQIDGDTEYCLNDFKTFKKEDLYSSFDNNNNNNNNNINTNNNNINHVNTEAMTDEELAQYLSNQENQPSIDQDFAVALQLQNQENAKAGYRKPKESKKDKKQQNNNNNNNNKDSKFCKTQ